MTALDDPHLFDRLSNFTNLGLEGQEAALKPGKRIGPRAGQFRGNVRGVSWASRSTYAQLVDEIHQELDGHH